MRLLEFKHMFSFLWWVVRTFNQVCCFFGLTPPITALTLELFARLVWVIWGYNFCSILERLRIDQLRGNFSVVPRNLRHFISKLGHQTMNASWNDNFFGCTPREMEVPKKTRGVSPVIIQILVVGFPYKPSIRRDPIDGNPQSDSTSEGQEFSDQLTSF